MEIIMFFIFVEEMKQSKSQQKRYLAAGAPGPKSQLFSQLKSDWEWDWNLKILNCPKDPAASWLERFREMGPDPELIQSITGKEVCFNGKQQVFCGSFVSVITRNLLCLSPLFYFYSSLQGLHQKRKTSWGELCVIFHSKKKTPWKSYGKMGIPYCSELSYLDVPLVLPWWLTHPEAMLISSGWFFLKCQW